MDAQRTAGRWDAQSPGDERIAHLSEQNRQLTERLQRAERHTAQTLMRATRLAQVIAILGSVEVEALSGRAVVEVAELFACDLALLALDAGRGLELAGHWGLQQVDLPAEGVMLQGIEELAAQRPVGVSAVDDVVLPEWLAPYGPRHLAWASLRAGDRELGLLLLVRCDEEAFHSDEESELRAISHRIALAIENGLLHRHMKDQLAKLRRLQELTAELAGTIELEAIGRRVAEVMVSEAGVESALVFVEQDGASAMLASADRNEGSASSIQAPNGDLLWRHLPLMVGDRLVGTIAVASPPVAGSESHELLLHLVGLSALAIDKALLYEHSREQARRDSLTGLLGHRVFQELLEQQLAGGAQFSVALLDIDDFKEINDLHGHQQGDAVLRLIADALRQETRVGDAIFRVGGEEFYVLLPTAGGSDAYVITERLRTRVAEASARLPHPVTVSAGVACYPDDARTRDDLLAAADAALYASKRAGKNRTTVAGTECPEPGVGGARQVRLELLLHKDADTVTHSIHVSNLSVEIARRLGLPDGRVADLRIAAKLHDIGKLGVPDAILNKPGPLDEEEFRIIKTHPLVGAELLQAWGLSGPALIIRQHHERFDGTGYPAGLSGEAITLESRIVHAADAYMAMTLDRPYRAAMSLSAAIEELERHRGTQFDPDVVDVLISIVRPSAPGQWSIAAE